MGTSYYWINRMPLAERTVASGRLDYVTDSRGSVVATIDASPQILTQYAFGPFGTVISRAGTGDSQRYLWLASLQTQFSPTESMYLQMNRVYNPATSTFNQSLSSALALAEYSIGGSAPFDVQVNGGGDLPSLKNCVKIAWCTKNGPDPKPCGGYNWGVDFLLPKDIGKTGGYIIQHIIANYDIKPHCLNGKLAEVPDKPWDYSEAWGVTPDGTIPFPDPRNYPNDRYNFNDVGMCFKGQITVDGYPKWCPGLTWSDMTALGFQLPSKIKQSGGLASLKGIAPGWSDKGADKHFISMNFDCCIKKATPASRLSCGEPPECKAREPIFEYGIHKDMCKKKK